MALSDIALRVLTEAGQHALRLATPPKHLPAAACNAVLRSLLIDPARAVLESDWWLPISWRWNIGTCGA